MTLEEAQSNVGAAVVYRPPDRGGQVQAEDGQIVGVSTEYVFVLYVGDRTPKATLAEYLTLRRGGQ